MLNCVIQSTFFHKVKDKQCNVTHVQTMKAYGGQCMEVSGQLHALEKGTTVPI
jgi:hypothetical protein